MSNKIFLLAILIMPVMLCSTVWQIGGPSYDFATIQLALDNGNVVHDDILKVYTGTYGPLKIGDKGVTITTDGSGPVYIEDQGEDDHCIEFTDDCIYTTILEGLTIQNGNPTIYDEAGNGGGIYNGVGVERRVDIIDCIIRNNSAVDGGGIYFIGYGDWRYACNLTNSEISNNTCTGNGGGIYSSLVNCFTLDAVIINGNSADKGGGIYSYGIMINTNDTDRVLMYDNSATTNGGAIYMAGYSSTGYNDSIHLGSVTIADNTSTYGVGGIYVANVNDVTLELVNSIIWDNDGTPQVPTGTNIEITYSDVEGTYTDTGNIDDDPEFEPYTTYPLEYYSPCIDKGNADSDYDDPDGSRADMGWNPFENDVYKWSGSASERVYIWKCFPRLSFSPFTTNHGQSIDVDEAWEFWNPYPTGLNSWYRNFTAVNGTCEFQVWSWFNDEYPVYSQRGYKLQRTGTGYPIMFSRGLLCEDDVELSTTPGEDWLGYFLQDTQLVLDAFPSAVANDAIKIWTQDWCISRSTVNDPWTGTPSSCYLHYKDAVLITTVSAYHRFEWETPARDEEVGYRPVAEHFTFVDELDYQPIYAYFDEDIIPQEIAVYVNDVCKGAQVVEDTICQICAYILEEDEGEEIEFAFWYNERSEITRCNKYLVYNEESGKYLDQSLLTGTPGIHYKVSFNADYENVVPPKYDLNCYPNPFNPELTISFSTTESTESTEYTELSIFNVKGQKVKTLISELFRPDDYNIVWKGDDQRGNKVSSGVYYIRLQVGKDIMNRKVILMK